MSMSKSTAARSACSWVLSGRPQRHLGRHPPTCPTDALTTLLRGTHPRFDVALPAPPCHHERRPAPCMGVPRRPPAPLRTASSEGFQA
eukprot:8389200-Alexandrium_andersonii.AAC.1